MSLEMKKFFLYLWQLPQNLLGLIVYFFNRKSALKVYSYSMDAWYFSARHVSDCGLSLGKYVFIDSDIFITPDVINHERGHQKQSLYLGWLYLLVIGLPSAIGNTLHRFIDFDYYAQPWEAWADKLGNVRRSS